MAVKFLLSMKTRDEGKEHCTGALAFILTMAVGKFVIFKNYKFPNSHFNINTKR